MGAQALWLRAVDLFSLEKRWLLSMPNRRLSWLFIKMPDGRLRKRSCKLKQGRFWLHIEEIKKHDDENNEVERVYAVSVPGGFQDQTCIKPWVSSPCFECEVGLKTSWVPFHPGWCCDSVDLLKLMHIMLLCSNLRPLIHMLELS